MYKNENTENKIPLKKRLQGIKSDVPNSFCTFEMFAEDYFEAWIQITGEEKYTNFYKENVLSYNLKESGYVCLMTEMIALSEKLDEPEETELLYKTLIEPFAESI